MTYIYNHVNVLYVKNEVFKLCICVVRESYVSHSLFDQTKLFAAYAYSVKQSYELTYDETKL